MTTERMRALCAAFLVFGVGGSVAIGCATTTSNRTGDQLDVSQYPPDIRDAYKVFAVRCSRCHTLARPLNARIRDPQQWVRYVQRMRLNPSSGINAKNGEIILRFLLYYMHEKEKARGELDSESELPAEASGDELPPGAADDSAQTSGPAVGAADGATGDGPKLVSTTDSNAEGTPKPQAPQASETEAQP